MIPAIDLPQLNHLDAGNCWPLLHNSYTSMMWGSQGNESMLKLWDSLSVSEQQHWD